MKLFITVSLFSVAFSVAASADFSAKASLAAAEQCPTEYVITGPQEFQGYSVFDYNCLSSRISNAEAALKTNVTAVQKLDQLVAAVATSRNGRHPISADQVRQELRKIAQKF